MSAADENSFADSIALTHQVRCPHCGEQVTSPALRNTCPKCGARFDVLPTGVGGHGAAEPGSGASTRADPPCPATTIDERSTAERVRWVVIRRVGVTWVVAISIPFFFCLAFLCPIGFVSAVEQDSIALGLLAAFIGAVAVLFGWALGFVFFGREEVFLDADGLTRKRQLGRLVLTRRVPLFAIEKFTAVNLGLMGGYPLDYGWCVGVSMGGPFRDMRIAAGVGYDQDSLVWLATYLESGRDLLADAGFRTKSAQESAPQ